MAPGPTPHTPHTRHTRRSTPRRGQGSAETSSARGQSEACHWDGGSSRHGPFPFGYKPDMNGYIKRPLHVRVLLIKSLHQADFGRCPGATGNQQQMNWRKPIPGVAELGVPIIGG